MATRDLEVLAVVGGERFGDQMVQMLGAVEHRSARIRGCASEERLPLGPPCQRHGRQWAA